MDWLSLIKTAISVGLEAYKQGRIAAANKEATDGAAIVARLHANFESAKADPGLPKGVN